MHAYAHPSAHLPLLQAYGGKFEACYIILHEFCQWDGSLPNQDFEQKAKRILWQQVMEAADIGKLATLNQLLMARINARKPIEANIEAAARLEQFATGLAHFQFPDEGMFNDLNLGKYVNMFKTIGPLGVVYVPEFPADKCPDANWQVTNLKSLVGAGRFDWMHQSESGLVSFDDFEKIEFPYRGTVISLDLKLLLTVDHESNFTLLYGTRNRLEKLVQIFEFEGFFADETTLHDWWDDKQDVETS